MAWQSVGSYDGPSTQPFQSLLDLPSKCRRSDAVANVDADGALEQRFTARFAKEELGQGVASCQKVPLLADTGQGFVTFAT